MSLIVAGRFQTFDKAEQAASRLFSRGVLEDDVSLFYVNPPGQHAIFPTGGDVDVDLGSSHAADFQRGSDARPAAGCP